jgi:S1-C subfamily serine protease
MQRILLVSVLISACATGASSPPPQAAGAPKPARAEVSSQTPETGPPRASTEQILIATVTNDKATPYIGVIDREGLHVIVEQGLGRVLARLKVSPVLQQGRFQGFRVTALDPAWNGAGILLDDIITRLNGQPIERPEEAQAAFESLRVASEISLELLREGKPKKLRYRIESRVNNE